MPQHYARQRGARLVSRCASQRLSVKSSIRCIPSAKVLPARVGTTPIYKQLSFRWCRITRNKRSLTFSLPRGHDCQTQMTPSYSALGPSSRIARFLPATSCSAAHNHHRRRLLYVTEAFAPCLRSSLVAPPVPVAATCLPRAGSPRRHLNHPAPSPAIATAFGPTGSPRRGTVSP